MTGRHGSTKPGPWLGSETRRAAAQVVLRRIATTLAHAADGADGIFAGRTHPDDPISGVAFTAEGNVDAQRPQERLRPAQSTGECARVFGPAGGAIRTTVPAATGADPQEVDGGPPRQSSCSDRRRRSAR